MTKIKEVIEAIEVENSRGEVFLDDLNLFRKYEKMVKQMKYAFYGNIKKTNKNNFSRL